MLFLLTICFIVLSTLYFYYSTSSIYRYWKKRGVKYVEPDYFFGNLRQVVLRKESLRQRVRSLYYSYGNARYVGCFQFFKPCLLIRDPELLKQLTIKEFESFADHNFPVSEKVDPLWANSLPSKTVAEGWHEARSKITPYFTAKNLRIMVPLILESSKTLTDHLKSKKGPIIIESKETFSRLAGDIIASVAFGVDIQSVLGKNNKFYTLIKETIDFTGFKGLLFIGYSCFPNLLKYFKVQMYKQDTANFFTNLIKDNLEERRIKNIIRPDFLHLLTRDEFTLTEIVAHSMIFFFASFETLSHIMAFSCYELALNPDVQNKLYNEITEVLKLFDGEVTYEAISEMSYLDQVVTELLRLHSPTFSTDRKCLKSYTIQPKHPDEQELHIEKGSYIWIPINEFHLDPTHYPNPTKFDPERFSSKNKGKLIPYTYLPFGLGPRTCAGFRYALMQAKAVLIHMLQNFEFSCTEKTEVPIHFKVDSFFLAPVNGIWIELKPRS